MNKSSVIFKIIFLILTSLILVSCTSISDITPAGQNKFIVSGSNLSIGASGTEIKTELYKKASNYCSAQGKVFEPVDTSSVDYQVFRGTANAELTFPCIPK